MEEVEDEALFVVFEDLKDDSVDNLVKKTSFRERQITVPFTSAPLGFGFKKEELGVNFPVVTAVELGSEADRLGVKAGFELVQIDSQSVMNWDYEEVEALLNEWIQTVGLNSGSLGAREEDQLYIVFENKKAGLKKQKSFRSNETTVAFTKQPLGFAYKPETPVIVSSVDPGSAADEQGVKVGMRVVRIDSVNVLELEFDEVDALLKMDDVKTIHEIQNTISEEAAAPVTQVEDEELFVVFEELKDDDGGKIMKQQSFSRRDKQMTIPLKRAPLGFAFKKGVELGEHFPVVTAVEPGSEVDAYGLKPGFELVQVDGQEVMNWDHEEVEALLTRWVQTVGLKAGALGAKEDDQLFLVFENKKAALKKQTSFKANQTTVAFTKRPLGFTYKPETPIIVTGVEFRSEAEEQGVKVGMRVVQIDSVNVLEMDYDEVDALLNMNQEPDVAQEKVDQQEVDKKAHLLELAVSIARKEPAVAPSLHCIETLVSDMEAQSMIMTAKVHGDMGDWADVGAAASQKLKDRQPMPDFSLNFTAFKVVQEELRKLHMRLESLKWASPSAGSRIPDLIQASEASAIKSELAQLQAENVALCSRMSASQEETQLWKRDLGERNVLNSQLQRKLSAAADLEKTLRTQINELERSLSAANKIAPSESGQREAFEKEQQLALRVKELEADLSASKEDAEQQRVRASQSNGLAEELRGQLVKQRDVTTSKGNQVVEELRAQASQSNLIVEKLTAEAAQVKQRMAEMVRAQGEQSTLVAQLRADLKSTSSDRDVLRDQLSRRDVSITKLLEDADQIKKEIGDLRAENQQLREQRTMAEDQVAQQKMVVEEKIAALQTAVQDIPSPEREKQTEAKQEGVNGQSNSTATSPQRLDIVMSAGVLSRSTSPQSPGNSVPSRAVSREGTGNTLGVSFSVGAASSSQLARSASHDKVPAAKIVRLSSGQVQVRMPTSAVSTPAHQAYDVSIDRMMRQATPSGRNSVGAPSSMRLPAGRAHYILPPEVGQSGSVRSAYYSAGSVGPPIHAGSYTAIPGTPGSPKKVFIQKPVRSSSAKTNMLGSVRREPSSGLEKI